MKALSWLHALTIFGLLTACSGPDQPKTEQFVGIWKSSRMASRPVHLLGNGDWEIRAEDGGKPLQYGVWRVQGSYLIWTIRQNGQVMHDANLITKAQARHFELREQDGSITRFDRLD
jgi:hypothetical protein